MNSAKKYGEFIKKMAEFCKFTHFVLKYAKKRSTEDKNPLRFDSLKFKYISLFEYLEINISAYQSVTVGVK